MSAGIKREVIIMIKVKNGIKDFQYKVFVKGMILKERLKEFKEDDKGIAVIEIVLILAVLMALVIVFRKNIKDIIDGIFRQISNNKDEVLKKY